jgi:hypothetical protein
MTPIRKRSLPQQIAWQAEFIVNNLQQTPELKWTDVLTSQPTDHCPPSF